MLPFQLVIYVINEMLNMIRMHSILMIDDYVYIYGFELILLIIFWFSYTMMSYFVFSCIYIVLK